MTMGWHRELDLNLMVRHLKINDSVISFVPLTNIMVFSVWKTSEVCLNP